MLCDSWDVNYDYEILKLYYYNNKRMCEMIGGVATKTTDLAWATCSLFFENNNKKFKVKKLKLNLHVDNIVIYMQNFKSNYLIFWAVQKWQNLISIVVNGADFQNLKIYQILLFLCSPEYKISRVQNFACW
jgi:hypothetical protein